MLHWCPPCPRLNSWEKFCQSYTFYCTNWIYIQATSFTLSNVKALLFHSVDGDLESATLGLKHHQAVKGSNLQTNMVAVEQSRLINKDIYIDMNLFQGEDGNVETELHFYDEAGQKSASRHWPFCPFGWMYLRTSFFTFVKDETQDHCRPRCGVIDA